MNVCGREDESLRSRLSVLNSRCNVELQSAVSDDQKVQRTIGSLYGFWGGAKKVRTGLLER